MLVNVRKLSAQELVQKDARELQDNDEAATGLRTELRLCEGFLMQGMPPGSDSSQGFLSALKGQ